MSWPRRVVTAHGKAVAGSWHGMVRLGRGSGVAVARLDGSAVRLGQGEPRGTGVHARARVLVSQGCRVAVPCAGHKHPGPATRRSGEGRRRLRGVTSGVVGSCTRVARRPDGERDVLRPATDGSSAA
jgi:hypothetical protein